MKRVIIKLNEKVESELDLRNLSQIDFEKNLGLIRKIKLLYKNRQVLVGKLFSIKIEKTAKKENELVISNLNKNCNFIGWRWKKNILRINSNVGSFLGAKMTGGSIYVEGAAENYVGSQMKNGNIFVKSNCLDFVGCPLPGNKIGMSGGVIIINGNVRDYLGLNMRKGMIYVNGNSGNYSCNNMLAGTVIIKKKIGKYLGFGMKRGTILIRQNLINKKIFFENKELDLTFINLIYDFFFKNYGIKIFKKKAKFRRFFGDRNIDGMGELLIGKL